MKLGVLTLWTNGMSATPAPALSPPGPARPALRALPRGGDVAPLAERPIAAARQDDVLGADAKPLFAVDDLSYAMVAPPAPASKPRRKSKSAPRSKKRAVARA